MSTGYGDKVTELLRVANGTADMLDMMSAYYEDKDGTGDALSLLASSLHRAVSEAMEADGGEQTV